MKKEKISCEQCAAPLTITDRKLAICEFCKSQYYLDGYDGPITTTGYNYDTNSRKNILDNLYWRKDWVDAEPTWKPEPVWVDGGVSSRSVTPAVWVNSKQKKERKWNSEEKSTDKKTQKKSLRQLLRR
jgi:hypothetical protein